MSAIVQKPIAPSNQNENNNNTNSTPKIKIDPKLGSTQATKKIPKKVNGTPPTKNGQKPNHSPNSKPLAASPFKGCVPILAKPTGNQVPLAPLVPKGGLCNNANAKSISPSNKPQKPSNKSSNNNTNSSSNPNPNNNHNLNQNNTQNNQQNRIILNGNLQSILAAVGGSNPQTLNQQQLAQHLAAASKQQSNQMPNSVGANQFSYQPQGLPIAPKNSNPLSAPVNNNSVSKTQSNSNINPAINPNTPESASNSSNPSAPTVFTATTTADGQIFFQNANINQNQNLQQQFMQQNLINLMQQQQQQNVAAASKNIAPQNQQQQPFFFGQNQFNHMIQQQQNMQHIHQQQQQQHFLNNQQHMLTQPVASSTPTPISSSQDPNAGNTPENMLRQKLLQEEQKFHKLQQQLKQSVGEPLPQKIIAIRPKQEMNQTIPNEQMDEDIKDEDKQTCSVMNTSDPGDKRRGRPRLYVKNPLTGKSIKGKRLDGTLIVKPTKPPKILVLGAKKLLIKSLNNKKSATTNGLFPSPSTSISSSYSNKNSNEIEQTKINTETDSSEELGSSSVPSSSNSEADTDYVSSDEKVINNENLDTNKIQSEFNPQKVLTHVVEGYVIKESPTPFQGDAEKSETGIVKKFICIECKSSQKVENIENGEEFCSQACLKRYTKKQLKKSKRKSLDNSIHNNRKENNDNKTSTSSHILSPSKQHLLEDTTNNLSTCMKSKCKSHHKHHKHRRHHTNSSSSTSSRDKIKKKFKISANEAIEEASLYNQTRTLPIQQNFSNISLSPKLTYQQAPQQYNTPNTFNSNQLNHSYSSHSADQQLLPQGDPVEWNCDEVFDFVKIVAGVNVAQVFQAQEVDGSALSLIRDDHLVNTMQIKLGPALKIMSKFNELKTKSMNRVF